MVMYLSECILKGERRSECSLVVQSFPGIYCHSEQIAKSKTSIAFDENVLGASLNKAVSPVCR